MSLTSYRAAPPRANLRITNRPSDTGNVVGLVNGSTLLRRLQGLATTYSSIA